MERTTTYNTVTILVIVCGANGSVSSGTQKRGATSSLSFHARAREEAGKCSANTKQQWIWAACSSADANISTSPEPRPPHPVCRYSEQGSRRERSRLSQLTLKPRRVESDFDFRQWYTRVVSLVSGTISKYDAFLILSEISLKNFH